MQHGAGGGQVAVVWLVRVSELDVRACHMGHADAGPGAEEYRLAAPHVSREQSCCLACARWRISFLDGFIFGRIVDLTPVTVPPSGVWIS